MNKKLLKFASMLLVAVCLCVNFASCGDDDDDDMKHKSVDLGLPSGLKWATCNVGAQNPWECGTYFAWGETTTKEQFNTSNYTYSYPQNGTIDADHDAATVNWGGKWRMPTKEEQKELILNCYWEWTDNYDGKGMGGYIVYKVKNASDKGKKKYYDDAVTTVGAYSPTDVHIFLPSAGYRDYLKFKDLGVRGNYWSSSYDKGDGAVQLNFSRSTVSMNSGYGGARYSGQPVRGVCK